MIEINLKVIRDTVKQLGRWKDTTTVSATDMWGEEVFGMNYQTHMDGFGIMQDLMQELGFEVKIEEVLADD